MPLTQHAQHQSPDTGTHEWNAAISHIISCACIWQVKMSAETLCSYEFGLRLHNGQAADSLTCPRRKNAGQTNFVKNATVSSSHPLIHATEPVFTIRGPWNELI